MEAKILTEIRDSERKADEIMEKANKEKQKILEIARADSSRHLSGKKEEIEKASEKKIADFREKMKSEKKKASDEEKKAIRQMTAKAEKNMGKAVELIMRTFEETI